MVALLAASAAVGAETCEPVIEAPWVRAAPPGAASLAGYLVLFFPAMAIFTWLAWGYFWRSFELNERIVTSPWLPIVWPFKFMMPAAGALLLLQGIAETIRCVRTAFCTGEGLDDAPPAEALPPP